MLNIALVDVGAGTTDISITKEGSIIAYGMIPMAGDCLTEAIARQCLIDFGTAEKVKEVEAAIIDGSLKVFDTATWTVNGETLTTYAKNGVEYISDGYFHESEFASAPAFDILIDGITDLTK